MVAQAGVGAGRDPRPAHHARDPVRVLVGGVVVTPDAQFAEVLTVVRRHHHDRVVGDPLCGEGVHEAPYEGVGPPDAGVVAVDQPGDVVERVQRAREQREGGVVREEGTRAAEAHHLSGRVRAALRQVAGQDLLGDPVGTTVAQHLGILQGAGVGRVRVPDVHVEEPAVPVGVAAQPVEGVAADPFGGPGVVAILDGLVEPGVPVQRRVVLPEHGDRGRPEPGSRQHGGEAVVGPRRSEAPA